MSICSAVESAQQETDYTTVYFPHHATDAIANKTADVSSFKSALDTA